MKVMGKMLSIIISVVMIVGLAGIYLPSRVSAAVWLQNFFNGDVTLYDGETILITSGITQEGTITIAEGANVNLEIRDLTIDNPNLVDKDNPCIKLGSNSILNLTISGNNNLTVNRLYSSAIDTSEGTLKINGSGSLTAKASNQGAGIGGGVNGSGGNIIISGGSITASSKDGAGIGEGDHGCGGKINISGGSITASSELGAGIGEGVNGTDGNIIISGGSITASSKYGAGIGEGDHGYGGNIDISGGSITASSKDGAGIGEGISSIEGNIDISGGSIVAKSTQGSDIGNGLNGNKEITKITGGSVNASKVDSPINDGSAALTKTSLTVGEEGEKVGGLFFTQPYSYIFKDVVSDESKKIYIWLPKEVGVNTISDEFPNVKISNAVLDQIKTNTGSSYTADAVLTEAMSESVTNLYLSALGLDNRDKDTETSLNNLNILQNLKNLDVSDNKLISLPDISKLNNLKKLLANDNQLIDISGISQGRGINNVDLSGQAYKAKASNISLGEEERIAIPILEETKNLQFGDFKGYTYNLQVEGGVARDISSDVGIDTKGVTIPGKDLGFIGNYTFEILGTSDSSKQGAKYSGDYTYTFTVGSLPVPVPTPKGGSGIVVPSTSPSKTAISNKPKTGLSRLTNTGLSEEIYVGIIMILLGTGALVIIKKKKNN